MIKQGVGMKILFMLAAVLLCVPSMATPEPGGDRTRRAARAHNPPQRLARTQGTPTRHQPRSHRNYRHYSGRHHYRWSGYNPYWPYYGSPFYGPHYYGMAYYHSWPFFFGHHYYRYYQGQHYPGLKAPNTGPVDLNVSPKNAQVYLNGTLVGKARRFDGFPGYLWLPEGEHELILYMDGYETVVKNVEVVAGVKLETDINMVKGESKSVTELSVARKKRMDERQRLYDTYSKDRPRKKLAKPAGEGAAPTVVVDSATLALSISPADAVIYLDGRFLGTASGLTARGGTLTVTEGVHTLEVMRPGYVSKKTTFEGIPGKTLKLAISLDVETSN